jgi:hypothetical protein
MERRTNQRARVDVLVNRFLDGHPYVCRMTDISPQGLRLMPLLEPTKGPKFVGLQFQLPGEESVFTASGEIVGEGPGGVGVRFTRLSGGAASAIARLVERQASFSPQSN